MRSELDKAREVLGSANPVPNAPSDGPPAGARQQLRRMIAASDSGPSPAPRHHRRHPALAGAGVAVLATVLVAAVAIGERAPGALYPAGTRARFEIGPDQREGESEGGDAMARLAWFYGQRAAPGHSLPVGAIQAARREAAAVAAQSRPDGVQPTWTELGPTPLDTENFNYNDPYNGTPPLGFGNVSGRVAALAVKPGDSHTVYMGAADGGVWKTTNGGTTWTPIFDDQSTLAIGALAVEPGTPERLWAGTGEATSAFENYYGNGVYYSDDGGATFTQLGETLFSRLTISDIVISKNHKVVLVATNSGLYRSTDRGGTWQLVLSFADTNDPTGGWVSDVAFLPGTNDRGVLAALGWRNGDAHNGLYQSNDGGQTFSKLSPTGAFPQGNHVGRMMFDTTKQDPNLIVIAIEDPVKLLSGATTVLNGVYRSDSGPTGPYTKIATSPQLASDPNSALQTRKIGGGYNPGVQAWYNIYVKINPNDSDNLILGLEEIYSSNDGGSNWDTIGRYWNYCISDGPPNCNLDPLAHPTTHPDQHAAVFTTEGGLTKLFVGNDGGVWSQTRNPEFDNDHWNNLNAGLSTIQFYYAEPSSGTHPIIIGGTQDNGTPKYEGSAVWSEVQGGDGGDVAIDPTNSNSMYSEYVYLSMAKTADGGQTWFPIPTPESGNPGAARFIAPFDLDPLDSDHIVALAQNVWESYEGIDTESSDWAVINGGSVGPNRQGTALGVRGSTIYAGWCGPCNPLYPLGGDPSPFVAGLHTNAGGTWHQAAGNGLPNRYITAITIDPGNVNHIWLTVSAFSRRWTPSAGYGHVYESNDGGENFVDISANLPDAPANDVAYTGGRLIVATDVGIFERISGTWYALGTGLPGVSTLDLSVTPDGSTLVAATHGRGVWTLPLS
jgi:photosystem II stability/assembly factor-like uncharacterized protein